jgi:prephenate dehydrogenase
MDETEFLASSKIAIVGLGLMGGSLALALQGRCELLLGVDPDPGTRSLASQQGVVDTLSSNPAEILPLANIIILAAPVNVILKTIEKLPSLHPRNAIVLDIGSTKLEITRAMKNLPPRFDPIGGHPMCGKEKLSLENANKNLFQNATFAFTALSRTSNQARLFAKQLTKAIGAIPLWLTPEKHDRCAAISSHVPYLMAVALALATPGEVTKLVGPGYRSSTRLASTPSSMMMDILKTNRSNILESIEIFQMKLGTLSDALRKKDFHSLEEELDCCKKHLNGILSPPTGTTGS